MSLETCSYLVGNVMQDQLWFPASLCQSYIRYNSVSLMGSLGGCWSRSQLHMGESHQFTAGLCEYLGSLAQGYLLPEHLPCFGNTRTWTENPPLLTSTDWETTSFTLDLTCFFCSKHWHGVSGIQLLFSLVLWELSTHSIISSLYFGWTLAVK